MVSIASQSRLGSVIGGRYRVLSVLGHGGMGAVYVAEHIFTRRRVALKLLKAESDEDPSELEQLRMRFLNEARAAAAVSHPNIVDVLDMGSDEDGSPFLAMELLEGTSLDRLLCERGKLSPEQTLSILLPIIGALARLHEAGIVHRDVKPSNIFLQNAARNAVVPQLLDFGLAHSLSDLRLTRSGLVMGTPLYMAPEHAAGEDVGPAADVWSMGVVLYECASGELPFNMRDRSAVAAQVLAGQIRPLSRVATTLPPAFAYAIERALRRDLSLRYASMRELAQGLVLGAQTCGLLLPSDPDPVGLPEYQTWLMSSAATAITSSVSVRALPGEVSATEPPREELARTPPNPVPLARKSLPNGRRLALVVLAIACLSVAGYWWASRARVPAVAPSSRDRVQTAAPASSKTRPALPVAAASTSDAAAVPVIPKIEGSQTPDAAAPRGDIPLGSAKEGLMPVQRARKVLGMKPSKTAAPIEPPAVPNPPAPDPFRVEAEWH